MINHFLVIVSCLTANASGCPIPQGYSLFVPATSKSVCIEKTRRVIHALGYKPKDFTIECRAK